jgi:hypothetical protein
MGNPYDALVDVKAAYRVKTSLHDLFLGTSTEVDKVRRLPIDCIIYLKDNLSHPSIDFKIELPTAEDKIKEQVDQLIVTKEDVNKQIISLLIGRFITDFFEETRNKYWVTYGLQNNYCQISYQIG